MDTIEAMVRGGDREAAERALTERIAARQDLVGEHEREARLAEQLGLSTTALRAWQLVVRDDPTCREAWQALASLYRDRADEARAAACEARAATLETGQSVAASDADCVRLVDRLGGREDVHARMWFEPARGVGYSPVHRPLTPEVMAAHLLGRVTVGSYVVRSDDRVRQVVLDLDVRGHVLERARGDRDHLAALRREVADEGLRWLAILRSAGLDPVLVDSGYKGRHLWCFLPEAAPAGEVRRAIGALLRSCGPVDGNLQLELFPKQDRVARGGLGNLVKLPLGVHLRTGRRSAVLDDGGHPDPDGLRRLIEAGAVPLHRMEAPAVPVPAVVADIPDGPPVVSAPHRPWAEADFDGSRQVGPVLRGCPVLRAVVERSIADRTMSRDAALVLTHTLGHLPDGVRGVNYLYDRVPDFPADLRMGAPLRGSPASCAKIRKRLPNVAQETGCACIFPEEPGRYPNPLRHLELTAPEPEPEPGLEDDLEAYGRQLERVRAAQDELDRLRERVVAALSRVPGGRWAHAGGEWSIEVRGGAPTPVFRRSDA